MKILKVVAFILLSSMSLHLAAEQKEVFGNYEVHYILINSTELPPAAAKAYDIPRSSNLAFLNISVLEKQDDGQLPKPIPAIVTAKFKNLIGQEKTLNMKEIRETGAIYYVSTFPFPEEEMLRFTFQVKTHADQPSAFVVNHNQKLYREE